mmetsp:Transcript_106660/g.211814  ORF Transcript_106660/g.211814 Transcript_106660/m.211814 type:complete len:80 (-) Transcript_106660:515-754(-)
MHHVRRRVSSRIRQQQAGASSSNISEASKDNAMQLHYCVHEKRSQDKLGACCSSAGILALQPNRTTMAVIKRPAAARSR